MNTLTFLALFGGLAAGAFLWVLGYNRSQKKLWEAEAKAETERERADAKAREAEILSQPSGSKADVINRL